MFIEIAGLCKQLGGRTVLDGVSLSVPRGQTVAIVGPSGAGKTTLLRCLNGLERPDVGTVRVGDVEWGPRAPHSERHLSTLRRRVGFVFQQWNLFANRSVLGNVIEAPVHVAGRSRADATAAAHTLLDRVGIGHRAAAFPHQLSGGEQQRAAIARALAMEPEVLLLDEPTSALDPARVDDLLALLRALAGSGLTLVTVTHDARVPEALRARVVALDHGRIVRDGRGA